MLFLSGVERAKELGIDRDLYDSLIKYDKNLELI